MNSREAKSLNHLAAAEQKLQPLLTAWEIIFFEELKSNMQEMPYSLMLDCSNDNGIQKMFPIMVRIFDVNFSRIMTKFLDTNLLEGRDASTADVMFEGVNNFLSENDIQWDHCMAIGLDNTNVNIGDHNSIKSCAKEKNEDIVIAGCPCHIFIMHLVKLQRRSRKLLTLTSKIIVLMFSTGLTNRASEKAFLRNITNSVIPSMKEL